MDYKNFLRVVEKQIKQRMTEGMTASLYKEGKNNGTKRVGIAIKEPEAMSSPIIYLEEFYQNYCNGQPIIQIVDEILDLYNDNKSGKELLLNPNDILTYENVKSRIMIKLINTERNGSYLENAPHKSFMDMSLIFYVACRITENEIASMGITNAHKNIWNVTTEVLWKDAVRNAPIFFPAELHTMESELSRLIEVIGCSPEISCQNWYPRNLIEEHTDEKDDMYILSNSLRCYGAACIAYPGIADTIGEIVARDYYIIPSSVHEVIILPCAEGINAEDINALIQDVNKNLVSEEEILGEHCYMYSQRKKRIIEMR